MEEEQQIPKSHMEILEKMFKLEGRLDRYADKMDVIAVKLDQIVEGLQNIVRSHDSTKSKVDGFDFTIKRHGEELNSLFQWKEKHEKEDNTMHDDMKNFMTTMKTYAKVVCFLAVPLYGQFALWLWENFFKK